MTEENKNNEISDAISNINKKLEEKMKQDSQRFDSLDNKISTVTKKEDAKSDDDDIDFSLGDDDDEGYITKKDLKSVIKTVLETSKKTSEDVSRSTTNAVLKDTMTRGMKDNQAISDFKLLNKNDKLYNKEFEDEVNKEMDFRVQYGRKADDPDLVYDSAAKVYTKWVNSGKIVPEHILNADNFISGDTFELNGKGGRKTKGITEYQRKLIANFGLNEEKVRKRM